jgi:uncharacterized repeat protein (TIGR02543 family)
MKITKTARYFLAAVMCLASVSWAQISVDVDDAASLRAAARNTGGVIKLTANIDITDTIRGIEGTSPTDPVSVKSSAGLYIAENTTLDLNGHTLSIELPNAATGGQNANCIRIAAGKTLTIVDGSDGETGTLTVVNLAAFSNNEGGAGINTVNANLIISRGTINATGGASGAGIGGGNSTDLGNSSITINGGTINATGGGNSAGIGAGNTSGASNSTITINGGTINATGGNNGAGIGGGASSGATNFEGLTGSGGTIIINGGNVTAKTAATSGNAQAIGRGNNAGTDIGTTVNVTCLYKYRKNTTNAPLDETYEFGSFTNDLSYKYVELVPFAPSEDYSIYISAVTNNRIPLNYTSAYSIGITVENTGTKATGELSIGLSGDGASNFNLLSTSISNIAVGEKATFYIKPKNVGLAIETYPVTVTVTGSNSILESREVDFRVIYVLSGNFTMTSNISITDTIWGAGTAASAAGLYIMDDVTLDLNGKTLSIVLPADASPAFVSRNANGIKIASGKTFTIVDNSTDGDGTLTVINNSSNTTTAVPSTMCAGINTTDGTLIINGGNITASGGGRGAGIGGGSERDGGNIIINGGTVTANSAAGPGAGIGGGQNAAGGNITITGGLVNATGGTSSAGIGGGNGSNGIGGNITITGGTVIATGNSGAGIGGSGAGGGIITITGGNITAITNGTNSNQQAIGRGTTTATTTVFNITNIQSCRTSTSNTEPETELTTCDVSSLFTVDHTLKWVELLSFYTINWEAEGGTFTPSQTTVVHGESIAGPTSEPTMTGHNFLGWFYDEDYTKPVTFPIQNVNGQVTLYAKYDGMEYHVTWNANGGTPAPTQHNVLHGSNIHAPAEMTKTGYTFGGWYETSSFSGSAVTFPIGNVTGNKEFWAKWTEDNTPIISSPSITNHLSPATYYNLKGKPLGHEKPKTPGVYLEKNGKNVKKVVVNNI